MQINFTNFFKSGFQYLVLTVLMLSFAIFVNFQILKAENIKAEQISNLQSFIKQNPLVVQKVQDSSTLEIHENPKEILIIIEKYMQQYPDINLKSLSLNKKESHQYILSMSLDSNSRDYIDFIDNLIVKSPISKDFPFIVEINDYNINVMELDNKDSQKFRPSFLIHTL